jgi:thioredoxin-related protein
VKATSIVDGIQRQAHGDVETHHLNLLSKVGREVGAAYGIKMVPATILFDDQGNLLYMNNGFPERAAIQQIVAA